ncbi:hypothetical protein HanXRQr2_Chr16g0724171 [Helianthus annuus]|uniref:Uncharacterized protein n=1 Tax=Helianthus annuus TaxID=4232 RepID=A0A9K3DLX3_HELAN|nr:hypothetical protein HanXRQr2_Chr16g0724171 [Helianthus annuus]KAJ0819306.1 hypothetical protein HanPSC8_Chr16g0694571 [Helianthus annuus]
MMTKFSKIVTNRHPTRMAIPILAHLSISRRVSVTRVKIGSKKNLGLATVKHQTSGRN